MGGGPSPGKARFGQFTNKVFNVFPREVALLDKFVPGTQSSLENALQQGQTFGANVFNYANPVIQGGGAPTPTQSADWMQAARQIIAPSGNLRTSPSAVAQEMNYTNLEQQRLQEAVGLGQSAMATELGPIGSAVSAFQGMFNPLLTASSGAAGVNAQLQTQANVAGSNKNAALESAGIGVLGDALKAVGSVAASDERLKKNIRDTGEKTAEGIPIKTFEYKGGKRRFKGVMAQDVEKVHPEAVLTMPFTGHKMIDLEKVNVPFQALQLGGEILPMPTLEDIYRLLPKKSPDPEPKKKKPKEPKEQIAGGEGYPEEPEKYQKGGATMKKKKKKKYQEGGQSTDTVPAMLTPGEFVLNRGAVALFRPQINAMNEIGKRHPIMAKNRGEKSSVRGGVLHAPVGAPTDIDGGWESPEQWMPTVEVFGGAPPEGVGGIAPPNLFGGIPGIGPGGEPREPRGSHVITDIADVPDMLNRTIVPPGFGRDFSNSPTWRWGPWYAPGGRFNPNQTGQVPGGGGPRGGPGEPRDYFRPGGARNRSRGGVIYAQEGVDVNVPERQLWREQRQQFDPSFWRFFSRFSTTPWSSPGYFPPALTPGAGQGPTMIPTTFDPQGYPRAVPLDPYVYAPSTPDAPTVRLHTPAKQAAHWGGLIKRNQ